MCVSCTAALPTVTENISVVTNSSPHFLPRLSSELALQHPLVSVIGHYSIASVFITYENDFKNNNIYIWIQSIIVVILSSPLKYNLSQHAFLPVVRAEWVT